MIDRPVLVDSNIFIDLLRAGRDPARELTRRYASVDLITCGMVRLEVLRGVKGETVKERLGLFFDVMMNVPVDHHRWDEATELGWSLDRQGRVIPATDLVIAVCALHSGAVLLTHDRHFDAVTGLEVIKDVI